MNPEDSNDFRTLARFHRDLATSCERDLDHPNPEVAHQAHRHFRRHSRYALLCEAVALDPVATFTETPRPCPAIGNRQS